jgi:hypothetical protein
MAELAASPWLFDVAGGAVILGLALAYGMAKSRSASRRQENAGERGARELYHKDESKS